MKDKYTKPWFPFWIDKWLFGSTRIELQPDERSVFLDLMTLSKKDGGYIRANVGVPYLESQLCGILNITPELFQRTLQKCFKKDAEGKSKIDKMSDGTLFFVSHENYILSPRHERRFKADIVAGKADMVSKKADEKKRKEKKIKENNKIDLELTQSLIDGILKNNPEASVIKRLTEKRKQDWVDQCRLLREADGRTPEQILAVIQFSQADDFWKTNILSMGKLREKWDQLWLKAKAAAQGSGYKRSEGTRYIKLTPAEEEAEKKLLAEYGTAQKKFMGAKGYKTEDEIPFDEMETFTDFKTRIKRHGGKT